MNKNQLYCSIPKSSELNMTPARLFNQSCHKYSLSLCLRSPANRALPFDNSSYNSVTVKASYLWNESACIYCTDQVTNAYIFTDVRIIQCLVHGGAVEADQICYARRDIRLAFEPMLQRSCTCTFNALISSSTILCSSCIRLLQ